MEPWVRGADAAGKSLPTYTGSKAVSDVPPGSDLYTYVMTAYQAGILGGSLGTDGERYFTPWSSATRGQVAKMTSNLLQLLEQ